MAFTAADVKKLPRNDQRRHDGLQEGTDRGSTATIDKAIELPA